MTNIDVVAAHDGDAPGIFLWMDPTDLVPNGQQSQLGPLSLEQARTLALELFDAIEVVEGLGA